MEVDLGVFEGEATASPDIHVAVDIVSARCAAINDAGGAAGDLQVGAGVAGG